VKTEDAIITLLRSLRDEGRVVLVSTHNLGSVPGFCDRAVLLNRTVLAAGLTEDVFTQANLERAFGGVLRHFVFADQLPKGGAGTRPLGFISDDERPFVVYAETESDLLETASSDTGRSSP
jgi:manganese/iron transport system ATP-binding protein